MISILIIGLANDRKSEMIDYQKGRSKGTAENLGNLKVLLDEKNCSSKRLVVPVILL